MKVIFLDIDGVLSPTHYMNSLYKMWKASFNEIKSHDEYGQLFFYQNCDALKKIIDETGAKIVISSAWRLEGEAKMKEMWADRNLAGEIIGITLVGANRGVEISQWINCNDFQGNYVIIDDLKLMLKEQEPFFVNTNGFVGLTMKDAEKAIQILNKK